MITIPTRDTIRVHVAESLSRETLDLATYSFDDERIPPIGSPRLRDLARPGMRVTIAFTDATRSCPDHLLIRALLDELSSAGVRDRDVTLLCATGLHRPMTALERAGKLGRELLDRVTVADHNAFEGTHLVDLGDISGIPLVTNRRCVETDLLIATGVVEPHQYAGYSGGAKTAVIGCAGEATIRETHGPAMLDRSGVRLGSIDGNPFQQFIREAGERIGLRFVVNVLLDEEGDVIDIAAGDPAAVHDHLVSRARTVYEVAIDRPVHMAIAGVSRSKGASLYQASRGPTYLARADRTPLLPGAPILLPAPIPEGAGEGEGERRFFEILSAAESPAALVESLRRTGFPGGAQRAYILAQTLAEHPIIVVGAEHPDVVRACHMYAAADMEEGLTMAEDLARARFGRLESQMLDLLYVPNAIVTLPRLGG